MNVFRAGLFAIFLGGTTLPGYGADNAYTAVVRDNQVVKEDHFSCTDSVYVFLEDHAGDGQLAPATVRWIDPVGAVVRTGKRNFIATGNPGAYLWDGLEFIAGGGIFSNIGISFLDPSSGLGDVVGRWKVEIDLSDKGEFSVDFDVIC